MALPTGYLSLSKIAAIKDAARLAHYTAAKTTVTLRHVGALPAPSASYPYNAPAAPPAIDILRFRCGKRTEKEKAELEVLGEVIGADLILRIWRLELESPDADLNPGAPGVSISTRETDIDDLTKDEVLFDGAEYRIERARLSVDFFDGTFLFVVLFLRRKNRSGK